MSKCSFKEIDLKENYVDKAIIDFANENKDVTVATLDREIKKSIQNMKVVIRGKKKLEII
jgi:rRNA-processing protein FCF1